MKNQCGQSTVEYIILVTAVIAVAIAFTNGEKSPFYVRLNSTLNAVTSNMVTMSERLFK